MWGGYGKWRRRITESWGDEDLGVGMLIIEMELELARGCLVVVEFENVYGVG